MPEPEFVRLPDGSLILSGKPAEKPGLLAGLRKMISDRFRSTPSGTQWWIPQSTSAAVPVTQPPPQQQAAAMPAYNDWSEIEKEAAKEQAIAEQLGPVSKKILASKQLVEGKWF